jgi:hypothetical protein
MKKTQDWDASMWYKGGFRSIALPRCYIVDKEARNSTNQDIPAAWNKLGFFTSNNSMTRYQAELIRDDPEYRELIKVNKIYGDAQATQEQIEQELFANDYTKSNQGDAYVNTTSGVIKSGEGNGSATNISNSGKDKKEFVDQNEFKKIDSSTISKHYPSLKIIDRVLDDTSLGGNDALNCYWSYNEDDDIVHPQTAYNREEADNYGVSLLGMGRVYAENIQKYQQILYMNFGIPVYKGAITSLFGGSSAKARLINRGNTISATLGYFTGTIVKIAFAFPLLPLYGLMMLSELFTVFPVSKYFEHRTAMPMYYKFCNMLIGHMAVNLGLYREAEDIIQATSSGVLSTINSVKEKSNKMLKSTAEFFGFSYNYTPRLYDTEGIKIDTKKTDDSKIPSGMKLYQNTMAGVPSILKYGPDMLAIMSKRALKLRAYDKSLAGKIPDDAFQSTDSWFTKWMEKGVDKVSKEYKDTDSQLSKVKQKFEQAHRSGKIEELPALEKEMAALQAKLEKLAVKPGSMNGLFGNITGNIFGMMSSMIFGTALQSIDYIGFKVEKSTSVSEGISNTTGPLEIANTINGKAADGANKRDSLLGMFLSGRSGVPIADQLAQFVGSTLNVLADTVGAGNMVNIVTGNGYADIPERWQSSSFTKSYNVELQLRARYADPVSWLQSVGIPLCCILAGCLPRGIGDSMYTSPFLVRCYCKGMFSIPTGIIENCSMSRGGAEFGWSINRLPLAIDVNLTIKDLSPILYIGMDNDMNAGMDEYMSTLTGLGLYERAFYFPALLRRFNRALLIGRNTWANPLWWSVNIGQSGVVRFGAMVHNIWQGNSGKVVKNN